MRNRLRALLAPLAVMLAYGSFVAACPMWTEEIGLDVWNYYECDRALEQNRREMARMEVTSTQIGRRLVMKLLITREVIDGRMKLADATEQFHALNLQEPEVMTQTRISFPATTDRDSVARQVISFVKAATRDNPSRSHDISCQLEMERHAIN